MAACSLYEQTNFAEPFHLIDSVGGSSTSRIEWQAQFLLVLRPTFFRFFYQAWKWKLWTRETVWCLIHSQPRALPIRVTVCRFSALRSPLITIVGPHPALEHSVSIFRCINNIGTWSIWTLNHKGSFHISSLSPVKRWVPFPKSFSRACYSPVPPKGGINTATRKLVIKVVSSQKLICQMKTSS